MKRRCGIGGVLMCAGLLLGTPPRVESQNQDAINAAVERGVAALKKLQRADGIWTFMGGGTEKDIGCTALVGLALLEADVPANDPVIMKAVQAVTRLAPRLTETYAMSAVIMFLDRHGDKTGGNQSGVIRSLAQKLLADQFKDGGWSYGGNGNLASPDNSNTQFAILALWIARKHNVKVETALLLAEKRFRLTQSQAGGWGYGMANLPNGNPPTPSMTCAGLLGLFLGFGAQKEKVANLRAIAPADGAAAAVPPAANLAEFHKDPAVQKAITFLGQTVGGNIRGTQNWLYFLWSLERVCVTYNLNRINGVDWYAWGSDILLRAQAKDGTWNADHGPAVDTAFAILFLRKANLVGNLRAVLPPGGSRSQPGIDESPRLAQELVKSEPGKQLELIKAYKSARNADYTMALGIAIPSLKGAAKDAARLALVERLETKTATTLRSYLEDDDRELRLAAAIAAGRKGKDELVPDLIKALKDRDSGVPEAAHAALKKLSGKDFAKEVGAWEAWWKGKDK